MYRVIIIFSTILVCCKNQQKEENIINPEIVCFSSFQFGSRTPDTIRHFPVYSCLFQKDTLIILKTDKQYNWHFEKAKLSKKEVDTINRLIKVINFKLYIDKNRLQKRRDSLIMYCGSNYGLVDSKGNIDVFIPYDDGVHIRNLERILYNIKTVKTHDTSVIIDYTAKIKRKYFKEARPIPVIEPVKFVPPVIKPDVIEK